MAEKRAFPQVAADFLDLCAFLPRAASDASFGQREDGADARPLLSAAFAALQGARVFDIEPQTWGALYHEADVYTESVVAGRGYWEPPQDNETPPPEGFATWDAWLGHYGKALNTTGRALPPPEHLPFPSVYIGFGGIALSTVQRGWRGIQRGFPLVELLGYVLTARGDAFEFLRLTDMQGRKMLGVLPVRDATGALRRYVILPFAAEVAEGAEGPWYTPYTLTPWVVTALVDLVNSYRTFVVQDTSLFYRTEYQSRVKRETGARRTTPPPYYVLRLKDELVRETGTVRAWRKAAKPEHRFDVRGHERIRVARGPMPLDEKLRKKLEKRRYRIFTVEPLDQAHWRLLAERRLPPKRPEEWIAFRRAFVKDFVKGPEGAPYIPAVRRVPRRKRTA